MKNKLSEEQMMIVGFCMEIHFGPCIDEKVETCRDCRDHKTGVCPGENLVGIQCWQCMEHKVKTGQFQMGSSF